MTPDRGFCALRLAVPRLQVASEHGLVSEEAVLNARLLSVARLLLPLPSPDLANPLKRRFTLRPGAVGGPRRQRAERRGGITITTFSVPAAIGAGIYRRDLPGTCRSEEVNAMGLDADPSKEKLQEFVRCAAMELESQGYFAARSLTTDPRWGNGSIYLFGVDAYGISLFNGDPFSRLYGVSELDPYINTSLEGQDLVSVGDAFGESFLYYSAINPSTRRLERKVTFVKRVVVYGLPILVGSGYYHPDEGP